MMPNGHPGSNRKVAALRKGALLAAFHLLLGWTFGLAATASAAAPQPSSTPEISLVRTIPFANQWEGGVNEIAFDGDRVYLSTEGGIYRTQSLDRQAPLTLLDLGPCALTYYEEGGRHFLTGQAKAYVHQGVLYVVKSWGLQAAVGEPLTDHTVCKSDDQGGHFTAIDEGLKVCSKLECRSQTHCYTNYCQYLGSAYALFRDDKIYLNAGLGPNLSVSPDHGQSWKPMLGELDEEICGPFPFEIVGRRLIQGGECPLDEIIFHYFNLRKDGLRLVSQRGIRAAPFLSNRNIHFIKAVPKTRYVFAGAEGALLRSIDGGQSFRYSIKYKNGDGSTGEGGKYPYILDIAFSSRRPGLLIIGGSDTSTIPAQPYLAYSTNYGRTWKDVTAMLPFYSQYRGGIQEGRVLSVAEAPSGRLWIALNWRDAHQKGADYLVNFSLPVPVSRSAAN